MEHEHSITCGACGQTFTGETMEAVKEKAMKHKAEFHSKDE